MERGATARDRQVGSAKDHRELRVYADMEAGETRVWLEFCQHFHYISLGEYAELGEDYDHICGQLGRMMTQPDAWVPPTSNTLRSTVHTPRSTRQ